MRFGELHASRTLRTVRRVAEAGGEIVNILHGNCIEILPTLAAESFHSVVTDPPYHLTSIVNRFGAEDAAPAKSDGASGVYGRASKGFMGKELDGGDIAFRPELWRKAYDILKPGAFLVAFASTRGYHRMVCAIEDAGFVIHPMLGWLFGTGFPKATRFKNEGMDGWRYGLQALKPGFEPICMAQKPLEGTGTANWLKHGVGGLNIDACRIDPGSVVPGGGKSVRRTGIFYNAGPEAEENAQQHTAGRWPANVLHDGSDEVMAAFAAFGESKSKSGGQTSRTGNGAAYGMRTAPRTGHDDTGTPARFFYQAKATAADRAGSKHPTVKPLSLMRWLCTLVTPPGGHILDPFAGSGTTLQAAHECGFDVTGCEMSEEYVADIRRRMEATNDRAHRPANDETTQFDLFSDPEAA